MMRAIRREYVIDWSLSYIQAQRSTHGTGPVDFLAAAQIGSRRTFWVFLLGGSGVIAQDQARKLADSRAGALPAALAGFSDEALPACLLKLGTRKENAGFRPAFALSAQHRIRWS
jgi:hypothetical protein